MSAGIGIIVRLKNSKYKNLKDGDALDEDDTNYPVAFTRNSKPKIAAEFVAEMGSCHCLCGSLSSAYLGDATG